MDPEPFSVEIPGLRLSGRQFGGASATPVLALHGWLDNASSFDDLARGLQRGGPSSIVALDLPGHGESAHHAPGHLYGVVDLVAEVYLAIEAMAWRRVTLLGHSLGAAISVVLAGTFPDRVERLVLLDGLGPLTEPAASAPARLARSLQAQLARLDSTGATSYPDRDTMVRRAVAARSMEPASVEHLMERGIRATEDGRFRWAADGRLHLPSRLRMTEDQVLAFLSRITCPALLVRARGGWRLRASVERARENAVAGLRVETVDGGHHVHMDHPERVTPIVAAFLSEPAPASGGVT